MNIFTIKKCNPSKTQIYFFTLRKEENKDFLPLCNDYISLGKKATVTQTAVAHIFFNVAHFLPISNGYSQFPSKRRTTG